MYRAYAADPQMRVNVGIRRRLAPLLQNDRRKIELMNGLLFALPGTPVIYYGDELGMGDNVYLGDRDAVRTPMQWSPDRNAGFSTVNPQRLYLPVIIDPEYHFETVNVEAQQQNPSSLLWWMRRIIALRSQHQVFGRGTIEFLLPENAKVLAFIRQLEATARRRHRRRDRAGGGQPVPLRPDRHPRPARAPRRGARRAVRRQRVRAHHGGRLQPDARALRLLLVLAAAPAPRRPGRRAPSSTTCPWSARTDDWRQLFPARGRGRSALARAWAPFFARNRWYAGPHPDHPHHRDPRRRARWRWVGASRRPSSPWSRSSTPTASPRPTSCPSPRPPAPRPTAVLADHPHAAVAWVDVRAWEERALLFDATADDAFMEAALRAFGRNRTFDSLAGAEMRTSTSPELRRMLAEADDLTRGPPLGRAEQHLGRVRPPGGHEDLPPGPGGGEPRPRDRAAPVRGRLRALGAAAGRARVPAGPGRAPHPGRAHRLRAQRGRRLALHPRRPGPVLRVGAGPCCPTTRSTSPAGPRSPSWSASSPPTPPPTPSGPTWTWPRCWVGAPPSCTRPWPPAPARSSGPSPSPPSTSARCTSRCGPRCGPRWP